MSDEKNVGCRMWDVEYVEKIIEERKEEKITTNAETSSTVQEVQEVQC